MLLYTVKYSRINVDFTSNKGLISVYDIFTLHYIIYGQKLWNFFLKNPHKIFLYSCNVYKFHILRTSSVLIAH